jgi:hypothetical protein
MLNSPLTILLLTVGVLLSYNLIYDVIQRSKLIIPVRDLANEDQP